MMILFIFQDVNSIQEQFTVPRTAPVTPTQRPQWNDRFVYEKPKTNASSPITPHPRLLKETSVNQLRGSMSKKDEKEKLVSFNKKLEMVNDENNPMNTSRELLPAEDHISEIRQCI
jgi:hypothetical protein